MPLVSLGMPVRNGALTIETALRSMLDQDYPHIEIIVSDNASTDETCSIVERLAREHPNIRLIRQPAPLRAWDNFIAVMREAKGDYFAWCAHDDARSSDYVSKLLAGFDRESIVLTFGDLYIWDGKQRLDLQSSYKFESVGLSRFARMHRQSMMQCFHLYGLWKLSALRSIQYEYVGWWPDMPLMLCGAAIGEFRYIAGPGFYYFEQTKTNEERALADEYRKSRGLVVNVMLNIRANVLTSYRTEGALAGLFAGACSIANFFSRTCSFVHRRMPGVKRIAAP